MTDSELLRALTLLGLAPSDIGALREGGLESLQVLQKKARGAYKKAALRLHPDRTNNDAACTADMQLLNAFMEQVAEMQPPVRYATKKRRVKYRIRL